MKTLNISKTVYDAIICACKKGELSPYRTKQAIFTADIIANAAKIGNYQCGSRISEAIGKNNIAPITDLLSSIGVLDKSKSYIVGAKSKEYRILDNDTNLAQVPLDYFNSITDKLKIKSDETISLYQNLEGIKFNGDIETLEDRDRALLNKITNGEHFIKWNKHKEGRLYTNITSMSKDGRNNLVSNRNISLASIDVKSCHPRLIEVVCKALHKKNSFIDVFEIDLLMDLGKWKEWAKDDLYTKISTVLGYPLDKAHRDMVKSAFLHFFSGMNGHSYGILKDMMYKEFPSLSKFVAILHKLESSTIIGSTYIQGKKKNLHSIDRMNYSLSLNLMKYESEVILNVCRSFREEYKDFNICAVFDCILVEECFTEEILGSIDFYSNTFNLDIKTEIENLKELNESNSTINDILIYNKEKEEGAGEREGEKGKGERAGEDSILLFPDFTKNESLSVQNQRNKESRIITLKDGRYRVSIKDKKINSKKNETLEEFTQRVKGLGAILAK